MFIISKESVPQYFEAKLNSYVEHACHALRTDNFCIRFTGVRSVVYWITKITFVKDILSTRVDIS